MLAIDGCGGAGKSTFAQSLRDQSPRVSIVHMDDFYQPSSMREETRARDDFSLLGFNWSRLRTEVLQPLAENQPVRYQIYDWKTDALTEWNEIVPGGVVVVEGVSSLRRELRGYYDFSIWIECDRPERLLRTESRDGAALLDKWRHEWMPSEDRYIDQHDPRPAATWVVNGRPRDDFDFTTHFEVVRV